ncbi:Tripeptidyl aminopeptidase [Madurella mycetomatis]|uniref:Tripeptidyl aminopeptidase n=1 Tax=Madurella mycetomatis TaxID=100816 RepID=A0A175VPI1_9PEZI|nr:Tripeptidyl aminopeptidase [Madurella mycetomatis]
MGMFTLLTQLALASTALALPLRNTDTSGGIEWGPCDFENAGSNPIDCGTLAVPLDYTNPGSNETLTLALIRSRAPVNRTTGRRSILFNFGGPGYEAVQALNGIADLLHLGVGKTLTFSCFDTAAERQLAAARFPYRPTDAYDHALADTFAGSNAISNICYEKNKDNERGGLIGTAFVARDLISVVDALGEDGMLRFWGLSYGSLLGATVAAMFPSRIDRLVLDGVVNGRNYYHRLGIDVDQLLSADSAFRAILAECIRVGPEKCALASVNSTAAELEDTLFSFAETFKASPMAAGSSVIDYRLIRELLFVVVKYPSDIANAAVHINNLLTGTNLTAVAEYYNDLMAGLAAGNDDAVWGIKCSDTFPRYEDLVGIIPDVERMLESSELFGNLIASLATQCATWPFVAKERYDGPFEGIRTPTPVLFIGNTYDPVTPVVSAKNMSAGFEGSVVVEQRGFGHASIAQFSNCTTQVLHAYFADGTLPAEDIVCEVDAPLF